MSCVTAPRYSQQIPQGEEVSLLCRSLDKETDIYMLRWKGSVELSHLSAVVFLTRDLFQVSKSTRVSVGLEESKIGTISRYFVEPFDFQKELRCGKAQANDALAGRITYIQCHFKEKVISTAFFFNQEQDLFFVVKKGNHEDFKKLMLSLVRQIH